MTAAPRKGRKVSFAADTAAPQADPWSQISTLRFMIHPLYGGELLVDFTGLRPRGLALAFARSLRSEEHTSELQSLMRISYARFCLTKKKGHSIHRLITSNT